MPQIDDLRIRSGSAAWWADANPTPEEGEPCWEVDKQRMKFGDGVTAYNSLPYSERDSPIAISLGDVVTIDDEVSSIEITVPDSDDYESLVIMLLASCISPSSLTVDMRFNDDATAIYDTQRMSAVLTASSADSTRAGSSGTIGLLSSFAQDAIGSDQQAPTIIEIPLHRMSGGFRTAIASSGAFKTNAGVGDTLITRTFVMWRSVANIVKVTLLSGGTSYFSGTQVICFGIKP